MYQLKRILVCVDLTHMDEDVIRYSSKIAELVDADTVYFLHVAKTLDIPEEIAQKYPDLIAPVDEAVTKNKVRRKPTLTSWRVSLLTRC